jgi:hypothetical protein
LFVFDALDESPENFQYRLSLDLEEKLPQNASMMFTSRKLPQIARGFQGHKYLAVVAQDRDMRSYIISRIFNARGRTFHGLVTQVPSLEDEVVTKVIAKACGM